MTPKTITNLSASVRQRLRDHAAVTDRPFDEILRFFAMERFLYRLSMSQHADKFILKGALMLRVWNAPQQRPTMDIDFLGQPGNDIRSIENIVREICSIEVEPDGIVFNPTTVVGQVIRADADYEGVRIRFQGLIESARVKIQIDIAFDPFLPTELVINNYPTILGFPIPRLKSYSRESTVSEKLQAMVFLGTANSRVKDFYDIWLISRYFDFDGETLASAIKTTFEHRRTQLEAMPVAFATKFVTDPVNTNRWQAFITRNNLTGVPDQLGQVADVIAAFLTPVLNALIESEPFTKVWRAPGPWES